MEVTQGRGTFVSSELDQGKSIIRKFTFAQKHSPLHLMEARKLLEPGIAALAAQQGTEAENVDELKPTIEVYAELYIKFQDLIANAAHNPVLARMLAALHELIREYRPLFNVDDLMENTMNFHKLIAYAIPARNPDAARALMYQHLENAEKVLLEKVKK